MDGLALAHFAAVRVAALAPALASAHVAPALAALASARVALAPALAARVALWRKGWAGSVDDEGVRRAGGGRLLGMTRQSVPSRSEPEASRGRRPPGVVRDSPAPKAPVFTREQALAAGISESRLRGPLYENLRRGVHRRLSEDVTEQALAEAVLAGRRDAVLSHLSAARFWDFMLPRNVSASRWTVNTSLDVTVPRHTTRPRGRCVRGHRAHLPDEDVVQVGELRVTSRERTWFDLAGLLQETELIYAADNLVRMPRRNLEGRSSPWTTIALLEAAVEANIRRHGGPRARAALRRVRVGSDSPMETRLRLAAEDAGLPVPRLNEPVVDGNGAEHHEPDMSWPEYRVGVEYEGAHHRTAEQLDRDIARSELMREIGWLEVRITAKDMVNGAKRAIMKIESALTERGWERSSR